MPGAFTLSGTNVLSATKAEVCGFLASSSVSPKGEPRPLTRGGIAASLGPWVLPAGASHSEQEPAAPGAAWIRPQGLTSGV